MYTINSYRNNLIISSFLWRLLLFKFFSGQMSGGNLSYYPLSAVLKLQLLQIAILQVMITPAPRRVYDGVRRVSGLRRELATRGSASATTGSGSSFSVGCGDQCGSSRRLQVFYIIPRPGVPRHIDSIR